MADAGNTTREGFSIFRAKDAPGLTEAGCMSIVPFSPVQRAGIDRMLAEGYSEGDEVKVLVSIPGFSLTRVWFKHGYPLPLHSHDADCLYFIIAGSLKLGTEELAADDSFFIPSGVPYTYRPGPEGVELLEFRHETHFNFANHAKGAAFWDKAVDTCTLRREEWKAAVRPSVHA